MKKKVIQSIIISTFVEIVISEEDSIFFFLPFYTYISYKLSFKLIFN